MKAPVTIYCDLSRPLNAYMVLLKDIGLHFELLNFVRKSILYAKIKFPPGVLIYS